MLLGTDKARLVELGAEKHVASMGDLKMRQNAKDKQAKMEKQKKWEQGIKLAGQGVGMAGKINGVPNKMMFSAGKVAPCAYIDISKPD